MKKIPHENLCTWEQTKSKWVTCVNNIIGRRVSLALATSLRVDYDQIDDILVKIAKANSVPQRMDMGKDIGTQAIPQKVDDDTNSNIDPTSRVIQIPIFGAILKEVPISLQFVTCPHKRIEGASNKKLKAYPQNSTNGITTIEFILKKFAEAFSKINLLKMEANKDIILTTTKLNVNYISFNFLLWLCNKAMIIIYQQVRHM